MDPLTLFDLLAEQVLAQKELAWLQNRPTAVVTALLIAFFGLKAKGTG